MKIYAPVKDANGVYASVRFVNGVGETDNPHLIEWFKSHGYHVPIETTPAVEVEEVDQFADVGNIVDDSEFVDLNKLADEPHEEETPNFDDMTPFELREWAKEHDLGLKIGNTRNKEKLLAIIRG